MDAKPQRPTRSFRFRDENVATAILPAKTIHKRNQSSPALSTLANIGAIKLGPRRTAFADVSNTTRHIQSVKDDSAIRGKAIYEDAKETSEPALDSTVPLSKPAQRPLSVNGIKGFFNNLAANSTSSTTKIDGVDSRSDQSQPQIAARKVLSKKSTVFYRDVQPLLEEPCVESIPESAEPESKVVGVEQECVVVEVPKVPEVTPLPGDETQLSREHDKHIYKVAEITLPEPVDHGTTAEYPNLPSLQEIPVNAYEALEIHHDSPNDYHPAPEHLPEIEEAQIARVSLRDAVVGLPPLSEPEEYWDEDGYDLHYDDDGYTTARSVKSNYTTSQTTVILAPRVTAKVEQEIAVAKFTVQDSKEADNIEADEAWDTSMVAEYGEEIFEYMRTLEEQMRPNPYYMDNQTEVQWSMRSMLMDWLVQVHHRFSLLPETLFLCVNLIDRFLSCKVVSLAKLQLVGATAIFIAAKYEEINCPSIQEIVYMVDGGYTVDEILKAERFMLTMLQFELGWPGPMSFLRRVSKADDYDLETRTLAKYFLEITIMDERFVGSIPSYTAAGAHCLARLMLKKGSWTPAHVVYSNYTYSQLRPLLHAMLSCCEDPQKHHAAVFDKYGDKRFKRASFFVQTEMAKGFLLPSAPRISGASYNEVVGEWRAK